MNCCTPRLQITGGIGDQNQFKGLLTANSLSGVGFSTLKVNEQPVEGRGRHLLSLEGRIQCFADARYAFSFQNKSQTAIRLATLAGQCSVLRQKVKMCKSSNSHCIFLSLVMAAYSQSLKVFFLIIIISFIIIF